MTLQKSQNTINLDADGVETVFAYDFRIDAESQIRIYYDGVLQDPTPSITVTGLESEDGGDITFDTAPPECVLTIERNVTATQLTDYTPYGAFPAETHEQALDKLTMLVQQLQERISRGFLVTITATPATFDSQITPSPQAYQYVRVNADNDGLEFVYAGEAGPSDSLVLTPRTASPAFPTVGMVVLADRVNWDPLGIGVGGAYLTMYLGATSGWGAITGQLD